MTSDERAYGECIGMDAAEQAAADWEMEATRLRAELAAAKEELSLVKCGEPNHTDRAYAMKNWLKTFGHKVYCNLKHGDVGFVLSLLQEGEISRGKAAEAIAELLVGNEPRLPLLIGNTFGEDEFAAETVTNLRAELAAAKQEKIDERRKGAVWAREYIAKAFEQWNEPIRATVIRSLATEMDAAIERGEVEVPCEK